MNPFLAQFLYPFASFMLRINVRIALSHLSHQRREHDVRLPVDDSRHLAHAQKVGRDVIVGKVHVDQVQAGGPLQLDKEGPGRIDQFASPSLHTHTLCIYYFRHNMDGFF